MRYVQYIQYMHTVFGCSKNVLWNPKRIPRIEADVRAILFVEERDLSLSLLLAQPGLAGILSSQGLWQGTYRQTAQ